MTIPILCKLFLFSLTILFLLLLLCEQNIYISYLLAFATARQDIQHLTKNQFFFSAHKVSLVAIINCYQIFLVPVLGKYSVMEESSSDYILVLKKGQSVTGLLRM